MSKLRSWSFLFALFLLPGISASAAAQERHSIDCRSSKTCLALLIGNSDYSGHHPQIPTAETDVRRVAEVLSGNLGYQDGLAFPAAREQTQDKRIPVKPLTGQGEVAAKHAWQTFLSNLLQWDKRRDQAEGIALFYFSGHGTDYNGSSLLLPNDLPAEPTAVDLLSRSLSVTRMFEQFREVQNTLRGRGVVLHGIFIIDACRVLIEPKGTVTKTHPQTGGFSPTLPPSGIFALYAATAGQVAVSCKSDDPAQCIDSTSVFTSHLLTELEKPAEAQRRLSTMAANIRWEVYQDTVSLELHDPQTPDHFDRMIGNNLMHIGGGSEPKSVMPPLPAPKRIKKVPPPRRIAWEAKSFPQLIVMPQPDLRRHWSVDGSCGVTGAEACPGVPIRRLETMTAPQIAIGRTEVTRGQYLAFLADPLVEPKPAIAACLKQFPRLRDKPTCRRDPGNKARVHPVCTQSAVSADEKLPVTQISWDDTQIYLDWLNCRAGLVSPENGRRTAPFEARGYYRLPTEIEWEHAARGGQTGPFVLSAGRNIDERQRIARMICEFGNGADASLKAFGSANNACNDGFAWRVSPAASFRQNAFGLYDVHGNVWEWIDDCWAAARPTSFLSARYEASYAELETGSPAGVKCAADLRVARGGSWLSALDSLSLTSRRAFRADHARRTLGFRVARVIGGCEASGWCE